MKVRNIPLDQIKPPRLQPRLDSNDPAIQELARSIQRHGLISPLTVTPNNDGYRLLAGSRRLQALRDIKATKAPCNIVHVDDVIADEITIAENLIRANLSPVEEAYAFALYLDNTGESQDQLADRLSKERTYVTRRLLLLDLDDTTLGALEEGMINLTQALLLRSIEDPAIRTRFIEHAVEYGANVRVMQVWVANYQKEQARARTQEGRDLQPDEVALPREVFMACDRCADPTSYDLLRPAYLCPACRQILAAHRAAKLSTEP